MLTSCVNSDIISFVPHGKGQSTLTECHPHSETGDEEVYTMYAVVEVGGKQEKVSEGRFFKTEKIDANVGEKVDLKCILFVDDAGNVKIGKDAAGVKVVAEVLEHGKEDKIVVFTYKAKKNESKRQGHRQPYSKLKVVSIGK